MIISADLMRDSQQRDGVRVYFVTTGRQDELDAIMRVKPQHLLLSYYYWQKRDLTKWVAELGYQPKIMLDSGAFSFRNTEDRKSTRLNSSH